MQKTLSPLGWPVAALICAGLWIGFAKAPVPSEIQSKAPLPSLETYVAAKDEKAAKDTPKKLGALPANAKHIPAGSTVILSTRIGDLLGKGGYGDFVKSDMFQELKSILDNETAHKIMENPAARRAPLEESGVEVPA